MNDAGGRSRLWRRRTGEFRMRFEFFFAVPAIVVACTPAFSEDFLTVSQAQTLMFSAAQFTPSDFVLSDEQITVLMQSVPGRLWRRQIKAWRVSTGGWFFVDQVIGRDDRITYALGLDKDGAVKGVEILTCLQKYDGIRKPEWRAQFVGRRFGKLDLVDQISTISGSTLSTTHITEGVQRMLATYALFLAPKSNAS
jgi:FMN-binding domain